MEKQTHRAINFNAGPATLPTEALKNVQENLLDYQGIGFGVMEMSHRSKYFDEILDSTLTRARKLMNLSDDFEILLMAGGASQQFAMIPMNFLEEGKSADAINSGYWTKKAIKEIKNLGGCRVLASSEDQNFTYLPEVSADQISPEASYLYYCSNNTIFGTQWKSFTTQKGIPTVVDMTSDFLCRKMDYNELDLVFAGAQKNLGPAGLTLVAIRKSLIEKGNDQLPTIMQYRSHADGGSRYNTTPTFCVHVMNEVLGWYESQGGAEVLEARNIEKANLLYSAIDQTDFYSSPIRTEDRSIMNAVFRVKDGDEALEKRFIEEASQNGMVGLKGHRSVGGLRASVYNSMSVEGVKTLVDFMSDFEKRA